MEIQRPTAPVVGVGIASARGVAERWRQQYQQKTGWTDTISGSTQEIYEQLIKLGDGADPDEVAAIIGNKSWTHPYCTSCETYVERAAVLDALDQMTVLCKTCLEHALKVVWGNNEQ